MFSVREDNYMGEVLLVAEFAHNDLVNKSTGLSDRR